MNIAILGLGTIGSGVYELLKNDRDIHVKRILDIRCWMELMTTDIEDILRDDSIELVVETMGGLHPAREFALRCMNAGKSYITANKFLVSEFAEELSAAAKQNNVSFLFSAACGGGIPFLRNLAKTRNVEPIIEVGGIFNGTTNYILDNIFSNGISYDEALSGAQALGYAERDPSSDVDGLDTQRKLVLACAVAKGALLTSDDIPTFGIRNISDADIIYARSKDSVIRLCAYADLSGAAPKPFVYPVLCKNASIESSIKLNINYCQYTGERIGRFSFSGQGAGKFPTAANIIRDIYDVSMGETSMLPENTVSCKADTSAVHRFYLRVPSEFANNLNCIAEQVGNTDNYIQAETSPVSIKTIKELISDIPGSFVMIID